MDSTVPAGAAVLLDFIRETETGRDDASAYRTIYGHNEGKLVQPITTMTLGEIIDAQANWTKRFKSSAAGGYQFMRATLQDLCRELHLRGDQVFDPDLQDRLGYHLLKRRGYAEFMAGEIDTVEFAKRLAMEWASMPVLSACRGAHRSLQRGQSYYAGDALNKALVRPERFAAVIRKAYMAVDPAAGADPRPAAPVGKDHAIGALIGAAITAAIVAVASWAGDLWHLIIGALS